jgi:hypothetical protein
MTRELGSCIPAVLSVDFLAFNRGFQNWFRKQERLAFHSFKQLSGNLYKYIVMETPQYTGTTVGNWEFSVNTYGATLPETRNQFTTLEPFTKASAGGGNPVRTMLALMEGLQGVGEIRSLNDKIYIYNATSFGDGKSVADFEDSPGWLRSVNQPGRMISRAMDYHLSKPVFTKYA